jgi:hypothetical protein
MDYHPTSRIISPPSCGCSAISRGRRRAAVISADHDCIASGDRRGARARLADLTVGRNGDGAGEGIRLVEAAIDGFAQKLTLEHRGRKAMIRLPLVGEFQIENALVAPGSRSAPAASRRCSPRSNISKAPRAGWSGSASATARRSSSITRTSRTRWRRRCEALRPYAKRKLVVVFGAGGDRDAGKRPLMGAIAAEKADSVIVTDDNPRSENPAAIRAAILAAAPGRERDRRPREAIRTRIAGAAAGRRAADRRQGPRDRPDRRRQDAAVQRSRGGRGRARIEGGMSAPPLWTRRRDGGGDARASATARCRERAGLSIDSRTIAPGEAFSRSRAMSATAMISSTRR